MKSSGTKTRGLCGCGYKVAAMGVGKDGEQRFRSRCFRCIRDARKLKADKCNFCGVMPEDKKKLQTDHIDGNPSNNDPSNVQTLCHACHIVKTNIERGTGEHNMKQCKRCFTIKTLDNFHSHKKTRDGRQSYCKDCVKDMNRERYYDIRNSPKIPALNQKTCNSCKQRKPISQFGKNSGKLDGYMPQCRLCWNMYCIKIKAGK